MAFIRQRRYLNEQNIHPHHQPRRYFPVIFPFMRAVKTDLDLERLPSGYFNTNDLVLNIAMLTYNILKHIGLCGLMDKKAPVRHPAKRRRVKTVMQELIRCLLS